MGEIIYGQPALADRKKKPPWRNFYGQLKQITTLLSDSF